MPPTSDRTRHVWVRPPYAGVGTPLQGLVVAWRDVRLQSTVTREALVAVVDERPGGEESVRMEWVRFDRLSPVVSPSPDAV